MCGTLSRDYPPCLKIEPRYAGETFAAQDGVPVGEGSSRSRTHPSALGADDAVTRVLMIPISGRVRYVLLIRPGREGRVAFITQVECASALVLLTGLLAVRGQTLPAPITRGGWVGSRQLVKVVLTTTTNTHRNHGNNHVVVVVIRAFLGRSSQIRSRVLIFVFHRNHRVGNIVRCRC